MISQRTRGFLETAAIGAAGALLLTLLQVPAGGLVGAMTAVAIASLCGRPTGFPAPLQAAMFMVVGASVGAAATPEAFRSIVAWPLSLGILLVSTILMYAAAKKAVTGSQWPNRRKIQ